MKYKLKITNRAEDELCSLERNIQERISKRLKFFISSNNPLEYAKKIKPTHSGLYRFRVGDYRVVFEKDKKGNLIILLILTIKHRKNIYN